ncbi:MAG: helix-turn-helix transcriptional regulator [Ruminococcus sp.]|nr:helix-turn-helix transcriptional regulator [Ruminococcus sp.]
MTFGEKIKNLRKSKNLNQTQLANAIGVSLRTIRGWEIEGRYPKQHELYQKLADVLGCDISYLMTEEETFVTEATEQYGSRGAKQAQQILEQAAAMFAGGELSDDDKTAFMDEIQMLYLDSKKRAKKFTPKKYLKDTPQE